MEKPTAKKQEDQDPFKVLKAKLKNFDELKDVYDITEDSTTVKAVLRKISEYLEGYIKVLIQILQPEEFHSLYECTVFDDKEKEQIFDAYKAFMILHREILRSELGNNEKDMIATIQYAHTEIKNSKQVMIKIVEKMRDSWKKDLKKSTARYFG